MGSSFTEFRGKGFWSHDRLLEAWLRVLSLQLGEDADVPGWQHDVRDKWLLVSSGGMVGCIPPCLDEFITDEERVSVILRTSLTTIQSLRAFGEYVPATFLNALGFSEKYTSDLPIQWFDRIAEKFSMLLRGELETDASNSPVLPATRRGQLWDELEQPRPGAWTPSTTNMPWERQEKDQEVLNASTWSQLQHYASRHKGQSFRIDQQALNDIAKNGWFDPAIKSPPNISRLCLYLRRACGLCAGGGQAPALGAAHSWDNATSLYTIVYISPVNDWFNIMVVTGEAPNPALQRPPGYCRVSRTARLSSSLRALAMPDDELILALQDKNRTQERSGSGGYNKPWRSVASPEDLLFVERKLGLQLPPFLRRVYLEVADGHFGPGYGLFRLSGNLDSVLSETLDKRELSPETWHQNLICLCTFGCTFYAALDCGSELGPVYSYEEHDGVYSSPEAGSIRDWLAAWVQGKLNPYGRVVIAPPRPGDKEGQDCP